jgi:hypothetical protein
MSLFDSLKEILNNRRKRVCSSDSDNETNSNDTTSVIYTIEKDDEKDLIKLRIELTNACMINNYELVKQLVKKNIDINFLDNYLMTPLAYGIESYKITKFLLKQGADPNISLTSGLTVLHLRVLSYKNTKNTIKISKKILKILLKYGADPNKKNSLGETPKDYAKQYKLCKYYHNMLI